MRLILPLFLFILLCLAFMAPAEKPYPKDYFVSPVKTTIRLSGTFGELRSNHFHSGIDIKGHIGLPLYAAAEGYVARVKIQAGGYGRALYIAHPSGYTTVYAHMNKFTPDLEAYVKKMQYAQKEYEVDLFPAKGQFSFQKGERVGEMGTTGYSFGPHLHFEIRDSKTEKPVNPLLFGIPVEDKLSPRMHQIKVYELDNRRKALAAKVYSLVGKGKAYGVGGDTVYVSSSQAGLALKTYDHMTGVKNWNGVYTAELHVDGEPHYSYQMESFSFAETRYLNAHVDYADQVSKKSYFNRLFALPGSRLSIYPRQVNGGVIRLQAGEKAREIRMLADDVAGNKTELRFWLKRTNRPSAEKPQDYQYYLNYDQAHEIHNTSLYLYFPKGTLYDDLYLQFSRSSSEEREAYSDIYHIQDYKTPVHKHFDIGIQASSLPESLKSKAFIAYIDEDGDVVNYGGSWKNGMLRAKVRDLGDFCIMVDTEAPKIVPGYFKSNMKGASRMTFKMTDNAPRNLKYKATVDGKWILMEHDAKSDLLFHRFDGQIGSGNHTLRIEATDGQENTAVFEREFVL